MFTSTLSRRLLTMATGGIYLIINGILYILMSRASDCMAVVLHSITCCIALLVVSFISLIFQRGSLKERISHALASASRWLIAPVIWQIAAFILLDTFGVTQRLHGVRDGKALVIASIIALPVWIWAACTAFRAKNRQVCHIAGQPIYDFGRRHPRAVYYSVFTLLFVLVCLGVFFWFYTDDLSFVWSDDGLEQHLNALTYWGNYLRQFAKNILFNHSLSLPLWDFSIGMGGDILTTLHYYAIGDPLTLLSVFVPASYTEYLYAFLIILRLYLAGVTFSAFCHYRKVSRFGTLCGSLVYMFCAFAVYAGVRHPYFLNPLIYLPLLLLGVEKVFAGRKPHLFIAAVAISAASNFYFFYMLSVFTVLYALVRFFFIYREHRIHQFFRTLGRFTGYYLTGLLVGCAIFIPVVMQVLASERMQVDHVLSLLYPASYYKTFLVQWVMPYSSGFWSYLGYTCTAVLSVFLLFSQRKRYPELKIGVILGTVFLLFPVFGYVLHGFSYVSNRWTWALSLIVALTAAVMIPRMASLTRREFLIMTIACGLFAFAYAGFSETSQSKDSFIVLYSLMILMLLLITAGRYLTKRQDLVGRMKPAFRISILLLTCVSIVLQADYVFNTNDSKYLKEFWPKGDAIERLTKNAANDVDSLKDRSFYRYEEAGNKAVQNAALRRPFSSTSFYFSIANTSLGQYINEIYMPNDIDYRYRNLDNRTMPMALANVKYLVTPTKNKNLSYGCSYLKKGSSGKYVYETEMALPFGYTYASSLSRSEYETLSFLQKQQAMMQSVIVDDDKSDILNHKPLSYTDQEISTSITQTKGLSIHGKTITVKKSNASLTLSFSGMPQSETYISFNNIRFSGKKDHSYITVKDNGVRKQLLLSSPGYSWYMGKHDYAINLGYDDKARQKATISFQQPGVYTFDSIRVACQPMDGLDKQIEVLKEDTLQNVAFGTNEITGTISLDQSKMLVMTIPYSQGWTAYVDGKETDILSVNTAYSGLALTKGQHQIRLTYRTPYLNLGLIACGAGLLIWLGIALYHRRRKN